jgi:preprotein translocase subunit SecD
MNMSKSMTSAVVLAVALACVAQAADEKAKVQPKLKIEFCWAEEKPTEGLTHSNGVDLSCTDKKAYLHKKAVLTNQDIAATRLLGANAAPEEKYFIYVSLTKEAAERMANSSVKNLDKPLVVLLEGKIVAAMTPKAKLSDIVLITGYFPKAEAERIAKGIQAK